MEREELFEKINEICRDVFDDEELTVTDATTAADVEEWDSLTHLSLINEIENAFAVKFTMGEVLGFRNLGGTGRCAAEAFEKQMILQQNEHSFKTDMGIALL